MHPLGGLLSVALQRADDTARERAQLPSLAARTGRSAQRQRLRERRRRARVPRPLREAMRWYTVPLRHLDPGGRRSDPDRGQQRSRTGPESASVSLPTGTTKPHRVCVSSRRPAGTNENRTDCRAPRRDQAAAGIEARSASAAAARGRARARPTVPIAAGGVPMSPASATPRVGVGVDDGGSDVRRPRVGHRTARPRPPSGSGTPLAPPRRDHGPAGRACSAGLRTGVANSTSARLGTSVTSSRSSDSRQRAIQPALVERSLHGQDPAARGGVGGDGAGSLLVDRDRPGVEHQAGRRTARDDATQQPSRPGRRAWLHRRSSSIDRLISPQVADHEGRAAGPLETVATHRSCHPLPRGPAALRQAVGRAVVEEGLESAEVEGAQLVHQPALSHHVGEHLDGVTS